MRDGRRCGAARIFGLAILAGVASFAAACGDNDHPPPAGSDGGGGGGDGGGGSLCAGGSAPGIELPPGFCATVFADGLGRARHMAVTPAGDVFVAIQPAPGSADPGRVVALRDADGDGVAERRETALDLGGNGIAWADGYLYVAPSDRVVRYELASGQLEPTAPVVLVKGLPATGDHPAKALALAGGGLYVNIGSGTNSCQRENRAPGSPGIDPCPERAVRAGVWRFSASEPNQQQHEGKCIATGVRNATALALAPDGTLWAAVNGRDELHASWPALYTEAQDLVLPGEQIVQIREGTERGWPYCYYDPGRDDMVLAPEYGGDGERVGRCDAVANPAAWLPAHAAPLGALFYTGAQLPARYRGGMFIANHGARFGANSAPPAPGYDVVYVPFAEGAPAAPGAPGAWEAFATGFAAGAAPLPDAAPHRPVGLAQLPDGSLLVSDDQGGTIWKIYYAR